jgi:single-strand DNA-binding protein
MNKVILKGRLTVDPDLKTTTTGIEYCTFSVAIDRYAAKDKEKITDFIPCKAWRQTAVFINKYFSKGKEILLDGSMQVDKYEKDGENRTYTYVNVNNVEFCGGKSDGQAKPDLSESQDKLNNAGVPGGLDAVIDSEEDLPF